MSRVDMRNEEPRTSLLRLGTSHLFQKIGVGTAELSVHGGQKHNGGVSSVRSSRSEQSQRRKRGRSQNHPCGDSWIEQVMRRKYIDATKPKSGSMIRRTGKKLCWAWEELWTRKTWKKMSRICCATRKMGLLKCKCGLRKASYDTFLSMAKACVEDKLEDEDLPRWTKTVVGRMWSEVLKDGEARNVFIKSIIWRRTDFQGRVVGEKEERGARTFTHIREHFKLFPAEEFLWLVSTDHEQRRKKNRMSGWWCGACGQPYDWKRWNRLPTRHMWELFCQPSTRWRVRPSECSETGHNWSRF